MGIAKIKGADIFTGQDADLALIGWGNAIEI